MITAGLANFVASILQARGYLDEPTTCPRKIEAAIVKLQHQAGLHETGELDPGTLEELDAPRFCALPDVMPLNATECKWPDGSVGYFVRDAFPGLTLEKTWEHMDWVAAQWNAAAGLNMHRAASADVARILATNYRHDGPSGILADAQLPCGSIRRSLQRYDSSESWDVQIMARLVMLHETGHSLGIPHISGGNVMAPTYNPSLSKLQTGDVVEAVRRYGRPTQAPAVPPVTPTPTPPGPSPGSIIVVPELRKIIAPTGWIIETR